jgi:hypothetical protein
MIPTMTLTDQHWRALAARGIAAEHIAALTGLSLETIEENLARAEGRRDTVHVAPRAGDMMTSLLSRPDLPRHYYRRLGM